MKFYDDITYFLRVDLELYPNRADIVVKPVIQPIRAKNTKVVPFKEKSSFHFVVL
jgi:hypothetical protein